MSSYKKRQKTLKRTHKERGQVHSRQHLGILEKHKDYVLRARDYEKKKAQLKRLHEKARNRNPDEFYYKMVNTKLKGGRHVIPHEPDNYTPEELQLMKTQDEKYVQMKLSTETKKIERMKNCLHHTKLKRKNSHIIFADSAEEVSRQANDLTNRNTVSKEGDTIQSEDEGTKQVSDYKLLNQRIQRCKELRVAATKMKTQKDLMKSKVHRVKVKSDGTHPAIYKWKKQRQK